MRLDSAMIAYIDAHQEELKQIIRDLCAIPAPSHHEEKRAAYCKAWFENNGFEHVSIDEALNVVCEYGVTADNDLTVFMAHTDTVFPDTEPMPFREDAEKFYAPGVGDDTGNLAVLMLCARYFVQKKLPSKTGLLFVANSCEEGLGNLKGSRCLAKKYGARIREWISFDGANLSNIVCGAVGSHRYRVTVRTEGGHSFGNFGNKNAIRYLAEIIDSIYQIKVPAIGSSRTTYNVGTISGGTSVNTIAQQAEMLCEYRSDSRECLETMRKTYEAIFALYRAMGAQVEVDLVGDRPCSGDVDADAHRQLIDSVAESMRAVTDEEVTYSSGSTDCNIPLSMGIPAVTFGVVVSKGAHTREESLTLAGLPNGCRLAMDMIGKYFE